MQIYNNFSVKMQCTSFLIGFPHENAVYFIFSVTVLSLIFITYTSLCNPCL